MLTSKLERCLKQPVILKVNYDKESNQFTCDFEEFHIEEWKKMKKFGRFFGENIKDSLKLISLYVTQ